MRRAIGWVVEGEGWSVYRLVVSVVKQELVYLIGQAGGVGGEETLSTTQCVVFMKSREPVCFPSSMNLRIGLWICPGCLHYLHYLH